MPNRIIARFTPLLLVLLILPSLTFAQNGPFVNLAANPVGKTPVGVAIGDVDGDGSPDLAVANALSNTVSILLGNGDGSYQLAKTVTVGNNPQRLALGDVNHDGKVDLIVGNVGDQNIEVLLGNGDGTFQPPTVYPLGGLPNAIVIGDFTGDGIPDLVVASEVPSTFGGGVQIFVGKGDGTFQASSGLVGYAAGSGPIALVAGDFDGNGTLDLAVSLESSQIDILTNDSNGNFTSKGKISVDSPVSLAVGDFNGDSRLDLAVVSNGTNQVSILIGFGDGTFHFLSPTSIQVGLNPRSIVAGDLNGDGKVDLVVSNEGSNTLSVLLGNGDGSFRDAVNYPTLSGPFGLASADVNHDGRTDVVVTEVAQDTAQVFLSNGDGTLRTGTYPAGVSLTSITSGDFNGDGNPDFAIVGNGTVSIFVGDGHGGFKAAGSFTDGVSNTVAESIVAGDFNNDGKIDLVVGSNSESTQTQELQIFLGNGDGTFQQARVVGIYVQGNILAFDFNGDGNLDVVSPLGTGGVEVDLGVGTGAPGRVENAVAPGGVGVAVGDFNGDGKLDMAVATGVNVELFLGNGDGAFRSEIATQVSQLSGVNSVIAGDFNGDGILDLAVGFIASGGAGIDPAGSSGPVVILAGKGDGTFQELPGIVTETGTLAAVFDFNRDGILDLAISRADTGSLDVMLGKGDGTFIKTAEYPVGVDSGAMVVADFNLDGAPDLAVVNSGSVAVLMNASSKGLNALTTTQLSFSPPALVGESLKLTASVTGKNGLPTGTVTFKEDGTAFATGAVASGQSQATSPTLTLGAHSFIALYTGDANFNGSLSTRLVVNVGVASTTTTLKASAAGKLGEPVIFTATVTPEFSGTPTGTVQFFADGQPAGTASVSGGQATFSSSSLSLGTHTIEADYSGDQDFTASVATLTEKIGKGVSAVAITSSANPAAFGQPVTLTATVTDSEGTIPTGQVVFQDSTTVYGILTLTGGTAQVSISTLTAGTHKITAQYEGDSSDATASASIQQVISGVPTTTSVATSVQPSTFGQAVTFIATVTSGSGMPGGTVTFKNGSSVLATVALTSGSAQVVASTLNVSTRTITAIYSGSNTFAASTGTTLQIVEKVATVTTLTSSLNPSPAGQSITLTAVVTSSAAEEATGNVTFKDGKTVLGTAALVNGQAQLNTSLLTTGTHNITAAFGGNSNFVGSNAAMTQVIQ